MKNIFTPMTPAHGHAFQQLYLDHLQGVHGQPIPGRLQTTHRDMFLASVQERLAEFALKKSLPPQTEGQSQKHLLPVIMAKVNAAEAYGLTVDPEMSSIRDTPDVEQPDLDRRIKRFTLSEESSHTQILLMGAQILCPNLGPQDLKAPFALKHLINVLLRFPRYLREPAIFMAEIMGVYIFEKMRKLAEQHYAKEQPERWPVVEKLFQTIIADELGHVAYLRSRMDKWQMRLSRALFTTVSMSHFFALPDAMLLLGGAKTIYRDLREIAKTGRFPITENGMPYTIVGLMDIIDMGDIQFSPMNRGAR